MDWIHAEAESAVRRHRTRDPFELLDCLNIITRFSCEFAEDGLKGFAAIEKRKKYAVINGNLDKYEQRIVAGHEAAHLILHENEILGRQTRTLYDFTMFRDNGRLENQANRFLADFLVSDEQVLDVTADESDYFATASTLN